MLGSFLRVAESWLLNCHSQKVLACSGGFDVQILRNASSFAIQGRPYEFFLSCKWAQNGSLAVEDWLQHGTKIVRSTVDLQRNVGLRRNSFEGACDER
jgi:hypothetical protein